MTFYGYRTRREAAKRWDLSVAPVRQAVRQRCNRHAPCVAGFDAAEHGIEFHYADGSRDFGHLEIDSTMEVGNARIRWTEE